MNSRALKLKSVQFAAEGLLGMDVRGMSVLQRVINITGHHIARGLDDYDTNRQIFLDVSSYYGDLLEDDEIIFAVQLAKLILKEQVQ